MYMCENRYRTSKIYIDTKTIAIFTLEIIYMRTFLFEDSLNNTTSPHKFWVFSFKYIVFYEHVQTAN